MSEKKEIIEMLAGNKLIAEFDGVTFEIADLGNYPEGRHEWFVKFPNGACFKKYGTIEDAIRLCDLKYHTSWDWLMPVVEKIAAMPSITITIESFTVEHGNTRVGSCGIEKTTWPRQSELEKQLIDYKKEFIERTSLIDNVWNRVIQFILWYNKTQQSKPNSNG